MFAFGLKMFVLKTKEILISVLIVRYLFNDNFGSIPRVFQTKLVREPYSFRICFNQFHQLFSRLVRVGI